MQDLSLEGYMKMRSDPFFFASECIKTQDQIDHLNPVKPFPKELDYLKLFCRIWQKERLVAVPKSRRMFFTWMTLILYLWDTAFFKGRFNAVVSKKEEDADNLLDRCAFMLDNIPQEYKRFIPAWKKTYCKLVFPETNSELRAFPSGSDQLRQYGASGILGDEVAFWPEAKEMYSGTFPTIENKGRMTMVSSPSPGFFKDLIFDTMDEREAPEGSDHTHKFPIDGIEIWKNPKNQFTIYQVHYTADPRKRDPDYIKTIKAAMPISQFNREFMLSWETYEGRPVYPDFNGTDHISKTPLEHWSGIPLLIGIDFGLTPSAVICQIQDRTLVVLDEVVEVNMGAERFTERLSRHIINRFPGFRDFKKNIITFCDPAGFQRSQSDETTCVQKLVSGGFSPEPGALQWEERRTSVEKFLTLRHKDGPGFLVDGTRCPWLTKGFLGGYQFSEKSFEKEPDKIRPLKNEYSHCFKAGTIISTHRGDVPIESVTINDFVQTPNGFMPVERAWLSRKNADILKLEFSNKSILECTEDHLVFTDNRGYVKAGELTGEDICQDLRTRSTKTKWLNLKDALSIALFGSPGGSLFGTEDTIGGGHGEWMVHPICIERFGNTTMAQFQKAFMFIMEITTQPITIFQTYPLSKSQSTFESTCSKDQWNKNLGLLHQPKEKLFFGTNQKQEVSGTLSTPKELGKKHNQESLSVFSVKKSSRLSKNTTQSFVIRIASLNIAVNLAWTIFKQSALSVVRHLLKTNTALKNTAVRLVQRTQNGQADVFDLTVKSEHCFYANGILVHNCHDALQYLCSGALRGKRRQIVHVPGPQYAWSKENKWI